MRLVIRLAVICGLLVGGNAARTALADPPEVGRVEVRGEGHRAEVAIEGAFDVPTYAVRTRDDDRTVVIDVADATLPEGGIATDGLASLVSQTVATTTARGVRLELHTTRPVRHRVRARAGRILVRLDERTEETTEESELAAVQGRNVIVQDVTIENRDGRDRIVLELNRAGAFRVRRGEDGTRLEVRDAIIARSVTRRLRADEGVVRGLRVRQQGNRVVVEADAQRGAVGTAIRSGERIVWMFAPGQAPAPARPRTRTIAREAADEELDEPIEGETEEVAAFLSDVPMQVRAGRSRRRYGGRRIDLDFKDADIHNILRLISEVGGVNVVTADDVSGTVTIRMRNVPWDQALDVILQAKGLGMVRRGNLIRVAPLATLEKEREAAIARRKQEVELAPLETRLVPVSYATAEDLSARVQELLTDRGHVSVDQRTNVLIVRDVAGQLNDIEELVRTLDTQTPLLSHITRGSIAIIGLNIRHGPAGVEPFGIQIGQLCGMPG
ncbi:MAG: secretin N-terminal domain-containing protein, partial [Myxococcota bacterium]